MDKKNLSSFDSRSNSIKEWTPPTYHKGREYYIDFYAFDPFSGRLKRKKTMLGRFRSQRERNAYAKKLLEELTQKLARGWNPWVESKYRQYVLKMHSDSSFREETMRDYLSRLGILEGWIEESSYNVYYPFQIDEVVLSKFMDYVLIERNCSSQTYNNYLAWLRTFCGWMQQRRYIHDNPLKAGICNREEYPWSSWHEYTGSQDLVTTEIVFSITDGIGGFLEISRSNEALEGLDIAEKTNADSAW